MSTYMVKKIEQAALLSDSFKLSLLEHFADEPRTVKQVAEKMNLKQTRLYRHVDSLLQAGLLKIVKEQQKRGTVERYYQTIATRFEIDSSLFSGGDDEKNEGVKMIRNILRDTEREILPLLANDKALDETEDTLTPVLMRLLIQGTESEMAALHKKLTDWIRECEAMPADQKNTDKVSYRALLMFYRQPQNPD